MTGRAAFMWTGVEAQAPRDRIRRDIEAQFGYDLSATVDELRATYEYNETCQATVPEAVICFCEANEFEDAIRNAISIGGDSDTLAAITGSMAEAKWGVPAEIRREVLTRLDAETSLAQSYLRYVEGVYRRGREG